jgi:alkylglycerol monooxygenase
VWALGVIAYDFCYYWHHRLGHESAVFWASHVVHHQSQEFNLSTVAAVAIAIVCAATG